MFLGGFDGFVTSTIAPIATGWSDPLAGREFHPLKIHTLPRRQRRVEMWRGGVGRCLCSLLARSFVCGCHIISTMLRFHIPLIEPDVPN